MLNELLLYLVGTLTVVGGILLLERNRCWSARQGRHWVRPRGQRLRLRSTAAKAVQRPSVLRRRGRSSLPVLQDATHDYRQLRDGGEQFIPVASIVGSVDGASQLFDRNFRPLSEGAHARLGSVLVAMRQGEPLPPIEVWAWHCEYYVLDGHHRVAAARAVGSDYISAHVVEVG
jgi:hypothetical protein